MWYRPVEEGLYGWGWVPPLLELLGSERSDIRFDSAGSDCDHRDTEQVEPLLLTLQRKHVYVVVSYWDWRVTSDIRRTKTTVFLVMCVRQKALW